MTNWIDFLEEQPPYGQKILVCDPITGFIGTARYDEEDHELDIMADEHEFEVDSVVTHWAYLPALPTTSEADE